jgi:holo-[acyl-carrier protein] synthase
MIEIDRFNNLNAAILKRFFSRVFTPEELEYIGKSHSRAAGIFAAKEAVAKALGCGIGPIGWQDIIISHTSERQPIVTLVNNAQKMAAELHVKQWSISITHTKKTAAAIAVAISKDKLFRELLN